MKFYKNFVIIWSVIYLTLAFTGRFFSEKSEWFPFFRWSLYSKSRADLNMSYVMVSKLGDSVFSPPVHLKDLRDIHNLSHSAIYQEYLEINKDLEAKNTFNNAFFQSFFTEGSEYIMYTKHSDLSKKQLSEPVVKKRLAFKNGEIIHYD